MKYNIAKGMVVALIPARGGSKGVPRKNIKDLGGFPLIAYSIAVANLSKIIGRTIISTDDDEIAAIAKLFGGEVPFMRPAELATDTSTDMDFVQHAMDWLQQNEGHIPEYFVHLRPTTPLREVRLVDEAIERLISGGDYNSLRSAHPAPESPYKWFRMKGQSAFTSLIPGLSIEDINGGRNQFPEAYVPDGYADVLKTETIIQTGGLYGDRMMAYISPVCTEVDIQEEFAFLEYELKAKGSNLYDYLCKSYTNKMGDAMNG